MANKTSKPSGITAKQVICFLIALLVLFGLATGIWFYLKHTNGGTEDFKTFTIEVDGETVVTPRSKRLFNPGTHTVAVKYIFDAVTGENNDYSVEIKPNGNFDYTVDGGTYAWSDVTGLAEAFKLNKRDGGFTFEVPADSAAVLKALYPGKTVTAPNGSALADPYIYELVVASYNEKIVYKIDFAIVLPVEGVEILPGEIIY